MENMNDIGLYLHNKRSYKKIKEAFDSGEKVVGIVHATGTGKTYNALQLIHDNPSKKITYLVPTNSIKEHILSIIESNEELKNINNLEIRTYQSLTRLKEEIEDLDIDILIIDEFHHIGAPVWGEKVNEVIDTHEDALIFGMTAYTVRDRGTIYERDMANEETEELFSNKIVSYYDICDAMIEKVLPLPTYKTAYINLMVLEEYLEQELKTKDVDEKTKIELDKILQTCKKRITEAPGIKELVLKEIKKGEKWIYFGPVNSELGVNDLETIKEELKKWFQEILKDDEMIFYTTTSKMQDEGKKNRDAFYNDLDLNGNNVKEKLKIMLAINQYNEGVHAPGVDGIIFGRSTQSDIVFFEQLGRALSVNNGEKAPKVLDFVCNYDYIKELENNLKDRIKELQVYNPTGIKLNLKLEEVKFDVEVENMDIFNMLQYVSDRLHPNKWEHKYELAQKYYEYYGNLNISINFKTVNGYEYSENGENLGKWISKQRDHYKNGELSKDRIEKLNEIGMIWDALKDKWNRMYELAKKYYEEHENLNIPQKFKTINGYEYDENGEALGFWLNNKRKLYLDKKLSKDRIEKLEKIGMVWNQKNYDKIYRKITKTNVDVIRKFTLENLDILLNNTLINTFENVDDIKQLNNEFIDTIDNSVKRR